MVFLSRFGRMLGSPTILSSSTLTYSPFLIIFQCHSTKLKQRRYITYSFQLCRTLRRLKDCNFFMSSEFHSMGHDYFTVILYAEVDFDVINIELS